MDEEKMKHPWWPLDASPDSYLTTTVNSADLKAASEQIRRIVDPYSGVIVGDTEPSFYVGDFPQKPVVQTMGSKQPFLDLQKFNELWSKATATYSNTSVDEGVLSAVLTKSFPVLGEANKMDGTLSTDVLALVKIEMTEAFRSGSSADALKQIERADAIISVLKLIAVREDKDDIVKKAEILKGYVEELKELSRMEYWRNFVHDTEYAAGDAPTGINANSRRYAQHLLGEFENIGGVVQPATGLDIGSHELRGVCYDARVPDGDSREVKGSY